MTQASAATPAWSLQTRHLVIDARCIGEAPTGLGLCTMRQLQALDEHLDSGWKLSAIRFAPSARGTLQGEWNRLHRTAVIECEVAPSDHPRNEWWTHSALPVLLRRLRADVFYAPAFVGAIWKIAPRQILMIHDDLVWSEPQAYPARFRAYLKSAMRFSLRAADAVIFPSTDAMRRVSAHFSLGSKGAAIWSPLDPTRYQIGGKRRPVILIPGSAEPRKNLALAVDAASRIPHHEVRLLGYRGTAFPADMILPPMDEDAVAAAFATAAAIAVPSRAEGFGYAIAQAITAGTPLVCSDIPVFRELADGCARFLKPDRAAGWELALAEACDGANAETQRLVSAGKSRSEVFSPARFADQFLRAIDATQEPVGNSHQCATTGK